MKLNDTVKILDTFPLKTVRGKIGKIVEIDNENPLPIYKVKSHGLYLCFEEEIEKINPVEEISKH